MSTYNMMTYLTFRKDISFKQAAFCDVDAMILASIIGLDLSIMPKDAFTFAEFMEYYFNHTPEDNDDDWKSEKEKLLRLLACSKRFEKVRICNPIKEIVPEKDMTFYAVTFQLSFFHSVIAFRGTDGSFTSWKENYNTIYQYPTPGQIRAREYVESKLAPFSKIDLCGHSKGANLAVYAGVNLSPKASKHLHKVYAFDGPGFIEDISKLPGFDEFLPKLMAFIPEDSIFGRLMLTPYAPIIVKSSAKGVFQHDMFSWEIDHLGLITLPKTSSFSDDLAEKINNWINSIPLENRKNLVDELFNIFESNGIDHIRSILHTDLKTIVGLILSASRLSAENRKILVIIFTSLKGRH